MTPTMKLRRVLRDTQYYAGTTENGEKVYLNECVLQQWWVSSPTYTQSTKFLEAIGEGEWRDIPIEVEE